VAKSCSKKLSAALQQPTTYLVCESS